MNQPQAQQSHTIKQTAKIFVCSIPTIYRMISDGELRTFNIRGDKRITSAEIARVQTGVEA